MPDAWDQEREKVIAERLVALDWAFANIDIIEDRIVKAYVLKLKRLIEEREKAEKDKEGLTDDLGKVKENKERLIDERLIAERPKTEEDKGIGQGNLPLPINWCCL